MMMNPGMKMQGMGSFPPNFMRPRVIPINHENSLYVGNLHPMIDEVNFYSYFRPFGALLSTRIMKNTYTGASRGFGFATFEKKEDAEAAQKAMNNAQIFNRELRVYFKKNMKNLNKKANLVVKNIHPDVSSQQLYNEFSKFGKILSCYVRKEEEKGKLVSIGYGYVQYEQEEDANKAKEEIRGKEINGQVISIENFVPYSERAKPKSKNLYLKQFPSEMDKEKVENFIKENFEPIGVISSQGVFQDQKHKKYYAFIAFEDCEAAKKAIEKFNGYKKEGSEDEPLYVGFAQSKYQRKQELQKQRLNVKNETNMYVRSLKKEVSGEDIMRVFGKYGEIQSICLKECNLNKTRFNPSNMMTAPPNDDKVLQFGFINYKNGSSAIELITKYKTDEDIKALIDEEHAKSSFIFYAQPKKIRYQYLKMHKKNVNSYKFMMMAGGMNKMRNPAHMAQMSNMFNNPLKPAPFGMNPMTMNPMTMNMGQNNMNMPMNMNPQMGGPGMMKNMNFPLQHQPQQKKSLQSLIEECTPETFAPVIRDHKVEFEALDSELQKKLLGPMMYQLVSKAFGTDDPDKKIPKITGMLIDLEVLGIIEVLEIFESNEILNDRIEEAIEVLRDNEVLESN